ncbi:MAG: hypothetical protein KDB00_14460 [Planctomycetales bacterium]|nr:hypothetical protein [Planctomycetales bacterium]
MTTVKTKLNLKLASKGRRTLRTQSKEEPVEKPKPKGKIPRISRLVALAIEFDEMLRSGAANDATDLAEMYDITQPRMSQIISLALLAPDIQETLLNLPRETAGRSQIHEKALRPICSQVDFDRQREMWNELIAQVEQTT